MTYTIQKLAAMAGVSVRTLHWYDEVGLLKPAGRGANGYRLYEEAQLLTLQQILLYRELGFELQQIKVLLGRSDFDKVAALESHRKELRKNLAWNRQLIKTIGKTIRHLKGTKKMKNEEMFAGFDAKQQARHEQYLIDRYGADMKASIAQSKSRVKGWTKAQWERSSAMFGEICRDLVAVMRQRLSPDSREAQEVIRRHYEWLKQFWTPDGQSYAGHAQLIVDSELRKAYENCHPALPEFAAAAIKGFAERELETH